MKRNKARLYESSKPKPKKKNTNSEFVEKKKKRRTGIRMGKEFYAPVREDRYDIRNMLNIDFFDDCRRTQELLYDYLSTKGLQKSVVVEKIHDGWFIPLPHMVYSNVLLSRDLDLVYANVRSIYNHPFKKILYDIFYESKDNLAYEYYIDMLNYKGDMNYYVSDFAKKFTHLCKVICESELPQGVTLREHSKDLGIRKCVLSDFALIEKDYIAPFIGYVDFQNGIFIKHPLIRDGKLVFIEDISYFTNSDYTCIGWTNETLVSYLNQKGVCRVVGEEIWFSPTTVCEIITKPNIESIDIDKCKPKTIINVNHC